MPRNKGNPLTGDRGGVLSELLQVHDFPTLPLVIVKLLEIVEDEKTSGKELAILLEQDYAISARMLRLANSAFYGLRTPVGTIQQAVVVLGFDTVKELALATSVFDSLSAYEPFALDPQDFWLHSLGAAKAARLLNDHHLQLETAHACFTAALLHDIGKYLLSTCLKDRYRSIVTEAFSRSRPVAAIEKRTLGYTHCELAGLITSRWRFPAVICDAIAYHCDPAKYPGEHQRELRVVVLANLLSGLAGFGMAGDPTPDELNPKLLEPLGISEEQGQGLVQLLSDQRRQVLEFFHLLRGG